MPKDETKDYAVRTEGMSRRFGHIVAVDHLDLYVRQGELFGFLGPNGAGKSTTLRMLTGILEPTSGNATVLGVDVVREPERVKSIIGYMSQKFSLYDDLTSEENLRFYSRVYMVPSREQGNRVMEMIKLADISGFEKKLAAHLSGGYRQRLALACAMVHKPKLIFLDEPTAGVDPVSRRHFWAVIRNIVSGGVTVVVTTHYMDEAELCDTLGFIYEGKLIANGSPGYIKREIFKKPVFEIEVNDIEQGFDLLKQSDKIEEVTRIGLKLRVILIEENTVFEEVLSYLNQHNILIHWSRQVEPSVEDIFVSFVEKPPLVNLLQS